MQRATEKWLECGGKHSGRSACRRTCYVSRHGGSSLLWPPTPLVATSVLMGEACLCSSHARSLPQAYDTLRDPRSRGDYDDSLRNPVRDKQTAMSIEWCLGGTGVSDHPVGPRILRRRASRAFAATAAAETIPDDDKGGSDDHRPHPQRQYFQPEPTATARTSRAQLPSEAALHAANNSTTTHTRWRIVEQHQVQPPASPPPYPQSRPH